MSSSPFGEPPPGTDLSEDHRIRNNGAVISTYVIAVFSVVLRLYTRLRLQQTRIAGDDWMIILSLVRLDNSPRTASFCGANQSS
jgi:hypothetical protein